MPVSTLPTGTVPIPPIVDVLEGQPEGLVGGSGGGNDGVEGLEESHAAGVTLLPLHLPALVPGHLVGGVDHVVPV